jgi:hypothetical protein
MEGGGVKNGDIVYGWPLLIKTPPFYEVNSFDRKWLSHEGISKIFFLDHLSPSFLGQKC